MIKWCWVSFHVPVGRVWMSSLERRPFDLSSVITIFHPSHLKCQWVFVNDLVQSDVLTSQQLGSPILGLSSCCSCLVWDPRRTHMTVCWPSLLLKSLESSALAPLSVSFVQSRVRITRGKRTWGEKRNTSQTSEEVLRREGWGFRIGWFFRN